MDSQPQPCCGARASIPRRCTVGARNETPPFTKPFLRSEVRGPPADRGSMTSCGTPGSASSKACWCGSWTAGDAAWHIASGRSRSWYPCLEGERKKTAGRSGSTREGPEQSGSLYLSSAEPFSRIDTAAGRCPCLVVPKWVEGGVDFGHFPQERRFVCVKLRDSSVVFQ
jgi:hypothetical protein